MDNNEAAKETAELVTKIMFLCKEYADKDGLDFRFVIKTIAETMLKFAK